MSNFTPLVEKEYEFEGDTVKVEFARLRREDVMALMPLMRNMSTDAENMPAAIGMMIDLLPKYIRSMKGLKNADGEALDVETLAGEVYFLDLATDIATDMFDSSMVMRGGDAAKNE
jgi:hypothetical protein